MKVVNSKQWLGPFLELSHFPCRKKKTLNKKTGHLDQLLTYKKAIFGLVFDYIYIYIYTRAMKLGSGPIVGVLKIRFWVNLKVRFSYKRL